MIALAITALGVVAVLLHSILPDADRAKNIAGIIQSFVTVIAIGVGAYLAQIRFQIFRTFQPHLTISHKVNHRFLSDSYIHIDASAIMHNSSKVKVELRKSFVRLQQVSPISDEEAESLYAGVFEDKEYNNFQWPVLEHLERVWNKGELVIEPGESHTETFEFMVPASEFSSVLIYTYFYNPESGPDAGTAEGWAATSLHDIMAAS